MRVNKTASAAVVAALSGSIALGASGAALAATAAPERAPVAGSAPAVEATTVEQFRVVEQLGELTRLTGALGRLAQDERSTPQQLKQTQHKIKERGKELQRTVERSARKIRPAAAPADREVPGLGEALERFEAAVDGVVTVDRSDTEARNGAAAELVSGLATVTRSASNEAGIPQQLFRPQGGQAQEQQSQEQAAPLGGTSERAAQQPPAPDKGAVLQQAKVLDDVGGVLAPVAGLLEAVLNAKDGQLSAKEVDQHSKAIDKAVKAAKKSAPARDGRSPAGADLRDSAVSELHDEARELLKVTKAGDAKKAEAEAQNTVQASVNYLAGTLTNKQLPKADISDLTPASTS